MSESSELPPIEVGNEVRRVLRRTPTAHWCRLALLIDAESRAQVMSRGDLASFLRASDLPGLANEATARRVRPGSILVLNLRHDDFGPRFQVVRFAATERTR